MLAPNSRWAALEIKNSVGALLESRKEFEKRFSDDDPRSGANTKTGPFASMQGLRAVFGAIVALGDDEVDIWSVLGTDALQSLLEEWSETLLSFRRDGYTARPYDGSALFEALLTEGVPKSVDKARRALPYVDCVSWVLSTSIIIDYCLSKWPGRFRGCADDQLRYATREQIADSLALVLDLQAGDGGWSWTSKSAYDRGHLFFTWSVIQGFADYGDYILGESYPDIDVRRNDPLLEFLESRHGGIEARAKEVREKSTAFLVGRYLPTALGGGLTVGSLTDVEKLEPGERERITVKGLPEIVPFYGDLYLLEALILNGYDDEKAPDYDRRKGHLGQLYAQAVARFTQLLRDHADDLRDDDKATLRLLLQRTVKGRDVYPATVVDPCLWPQLVRTFVLYRYYTDRSTSPDPHILGDGGALDLLLSDRRTTKEFKTGVSLWDRESFNLGITTRSIESLIDIYDYSQRLEETASPTAPRSDASDLASVLAAAILPHLQAEIANAVKSSAFAALADKSSRGSSDTGAPPADWTKKLGLLFTQTGDVLKPVDEVVNRDAILARLLGGEKEAKNFEKTNRYAYQVLKTLAWVSFTVSVRLFEEILLEAMLKTLTTEERKMFRSKDVDNIGTHRPVVERLGELFSRLGEHEVGTLDGGAPDYARAVSTLLESSKTATEAQER